MARIEDLLRRSKNGSQSSRRRELSGPASLKKFSYAELEDILLRHARWLEREEARRTVREDGTRFQETDAPALELDEEATEEEKSRLSRVVVIEPLQPVDPDVLDYLSRCPAEEWDEFEEYAQEENIVVQAREDPDVFMEYCFRDKDGSDWKQQPFHRDMQALIPTQEETLLLIQGIEVMAYWPDKTPVRDSDGVHLKKSLLTQIVVPREHAKCVAASTYLCLSTGLRITAGDMVRGQEYQVQSWSESLGYHVAAARCWQDQEQEVYEITTRTGRTTTLSSGHPMWTSLGWKTADSMRVGDRIGVARQGPFGHEGDLRRAWLVGFLIGNGCFSREQGPTSTRVVFSSGKSSVLDRIWAICAENEWDVRHNSVLQNAIYSSELFTWLDDLGLISKKSAQKIVPEQVFGWSREATIQFLQGYFDADGTYDRNYLTHGGKMTAKYTSSSVELVRGVLSLLGKLGIMGYVEEVSRPYKDAISTMYVLSIKGRHAVSLAAMFDGLTEKTADLRLCAAAARPQTGTFDTIPSELVCRLTEVKNIPFHTEYASLRKPSKNGCSPDLVVKYAVETDNVALRSNADLYWDQVVGVKRLGTQQTYSVEVDGSHVHVTDDVVTHNTTQISVGRTIWEIGRNVRLRCKIVAATPKVAKEILFDIAQNIELNLRVQRVFPDLRPDYKSGWSKTDIFVQRGYDAGKDPTVSTKSVLGSGAGGRADWLLFDDVVDFRNAVGNPKLRPLVKKAIKSTFLPLMPPDGRVVYSATPWNDDDATNEFRTSPGWSVYWRPAIFEKRNRLGVSAKTTLWPGKYNLTVLSIRKMQMGPAEFSRQYMLMSVSDEDATFPEQNLIASFDYTRSAMGEAIPRTWPRVGGMDLASSFRKNTGAYTVIFTFAIDPSCGKLYPIEMYRQQLGFTLAVEAVIERSREHRWEVLMVENNGYQQAMLSALEKEREQLGYGLQVEGFRTGNNKADPVLGLPGLAVVFSNGGFAIPYKEVESHDSSCECDVCTWLAELRGHPSARLSDTVMATWFAQRAALRLGSTASENYRVEISEVEAPSDPLSAAIEFADGGLVLSLGGDASQRAAEMERAMWCGYDG